MEELIEALALYCKTTTGVVQQAFSNAIVKGNNGQESIELTLVERNLDLPTDFFKQALENEKFPVAPTTENLKTELCM